MKKICSVILGLLLSFSLFATVPVLAAGSAEVEMGSVSGKIGDTVSVDLTLKTNPGFGTLAIKVNYDKTQLKLESVTNKKVFSNGDKNSPYINSAIDSSVETVPYLIVWQCNSTLINTTETGKLATFRFKILAGATSQVPLTVTIANCYQANLQMTDVPTSVKNGVVSTNGPKTSSSSIVSSGVQTTPTGTSSGTSLPPAGTSSAQTSAGTSSSKSNATTSTGLTQTTSNDSNTAHISGTDNTSSALNTKVASPFPWEITIIAVLLTLFIIATAIYLVKKKQQK